MRYYPSICLEGTEENDEKTVNVAAGATQGLRHTRQARHTLECTMTSGEAVSPQKRSPLHEDVWGSRGVTKRIIN
jgi:hypothetical protein